MDPGPHTCQASALPPSYITSCDFQQFQSCLKNGQICILTLKRRRVRKVHKVYMTTMNYTFKRY